ncbi:MAG: radical SAM/SPASM domain-containing protein [Candidatus Cloacimonadia bacterium]
MNRRYILLLFSLAIRHRFLREFFKTPIEKVIYNAVVKNGPPYSKPIKMNLYYYLSALMHSTFRSLDKGFISPHALKRAVDTLLNRTLLKAGYVTSVPQRFKEKYGVYPPMLMVLSPTQQCNLNCKGCYAGSLANTTKKIPFEIVDRIMQEAHDEFGMPFISFSGGEPFLYSDNGKTLMDIYKKYDDIFFLVFTNGTLITPEVAEQLKELGNVTPAISIEGFAKDTDSRRGKGTFNKILNAFENLRNAGAHFGVSLTATKDNIQTLLTDEFYDFLFEEQGITYIWLFQFMPIGRGTKSLEQMISPQERLALFRQWQRLVIEKKYCIADFWNSGMLAQGCIAYGRSGGYFYIDWNGNIMPCVFVPYYTNNIYDLYKEGTSLKDAMFSEFFVRGREWQKKYGYRNYENIGNCLMPCSIRDHYENFCANLLSPEAKPADSYAQEALNSEEYRDALKKFDQELEDLTQEIWEKEFLQKEK